MGLGLVLVLVLVVLATGRSLGTRYHRKLQCSETRLLRTNRPLCCTLGAPGHSH